MLTYKGTDKNMQCRDWFQYELGKEYVDDGAILCGGKGFHSCKAPLDVFGYFPPAGSRYFTCDADGTIDEGTDDSKIASSKLTLKAELTIPALVKAQIEYVRRHTTSEHTDPEKATAGDRGAATAGDSGAATAGDSGAATAGDRGAATAGYSGAAISRGTVSVEGNGAGLVRGNGVKIRGGLGAILVIAEENKTDYSIKEWKAVVVDGETVKADTWYILKNGELVEADD